MKKILYLLVIVFIFGSCSKSTYQGQMKPKPVIQNCSPIPDKAMFLNVGSYNKLRSADLLSKIDFFLSEALVIPEKIIPGYEKSNTHLSVVNGVVLEEKKIVRKKDVVIDGKTVSVIPFRLTKNLGSTLYLKAKPGYGHDDLEIIADAVPGGKFFKVRGGNCSRVYFSHEYSESVQYVN